MTRFGYDWDFGSERSNTGTISSLCEATCAARFEACPLSGAPYFSLVSELASALAAQRAVLTSLSLVVLEVWGVQCPAL